MPPVRNGVAPYMGAWIEIHPGNILPQALLSLPTWGRGLKYAQNKRVWLVAHVAPYMGAWIEMIRSIKAFTLAIVAPYMGAWIEI